jgi:chemotaxis family two-component system sensor kinase Cph1
VLNLLRCIPVVQYTPVQIVPAINGVSQHPVDLSYASLHSASQIYCEYLTNMGVSPTRVISLLRDGKLWGLIACHHYSPRLVPCETRKSCGFLGQLLSGEIARREAEQEATYNLQSIKVEAKLLEVMAEAFHPLPSLVNASPNLLDLIPAGGAAIVVQDKVQTIGITPGYSDLMTIVGFLQKSGVPGTFATRSLKNHFTAAESMAETAAGVIALDISRNPDQYVLFFRPELAETVTWAGNPNKVTSVSEDGFRMSPRKSFAAWQESSQGSAAPWTRNELRVADELRNLITVVSLKKEVNDR